MVLCSQLEKRSIDEKNRENTNHICGKLFCIMCKNTYDTRKALLLKDIPLGGCWLHT
jgi:hypothetical protein